MARRAKEIPVTVTYLMMEKRVIQPPPPSPLLKTALLRAENPPVHFYRYLKGDGGFVEFLNDA